MAVSASEAPKCQEQNSPTRSWAKGTYRVGRMVTPLASLSVDNQKLPKLTRNGSKDPVMHCNMCETIWIVGGQLDKDYWLRAFPTTLWE